MDDGKLALPDGKPKVKWTKDSLREKLSGFVDNEEELDYLVDGILDYMNNIENRNIEYLNAMDNNFNVVCNQHTLDESGGVNLCPDGITASEKQGLLFIIHNHPSNNPLQSKGDVLCFGRYNAKYNLVFTEEQGLIILKNNGADYYDIQMGWNDIFQKMKEHYRLNNPKAYNEEYNKYHSGLITRKDLKRNIEKKSF